MMQPARKERVTTMTTASASDVMASLNSLKSNGLNNDSAQIQTDSAGNIITPAGRLRNVTFITPTSLTTNPTVTSGSTTTLTCTGGATGVPTGAIAVILQCGIFAATTGGYAMISPHGGTAGQYAAIAGMPSNAYTPGWCVVPLSGGQIDVKAVGSNIVLQAWYIFGYIA